MKLCDLASVFCEQSIYSCFQWRGGESVFFKTMKRLLVWKPRNLSRVPFLFLEYCFSSAAIKPKLDIFFKKEKLKKKKKKLALYYLIDFESLQYKDTESSKLKCREKQSVGLQAFVSVPTCLVPCAIMLVTMPTPTPG